jgi:hypothetical protein
VEQPLAPASRKSIIVFSSLLLSEATAAGINGQRTVNAACHESSDRTSGCAVYITDNLPASNIVTLAALPCRFKWLLGCGYGSHAFDTLVVSRRKANNASTSFKKFLQHGIETGILFWTYCRKPTAEATINSSLNSCQPQ